MAASSAVSEKSAKRLIIFLVGYYNSGRTKLASLLGKHLVAVVGCETISLVAVAMLLYDIQGLCSDRTGRAKDADLFFHI